ncbi:replication initiation factor domain-containing protein [Colwellia sp. RE-S-Sl-9]
MNNKKALFCKVDALSLTWSPQELLHIKQLAKVGACIKKSDIEEIQGNALLRKLSNLEIKKNIDLSAAETFNHVAYNDILESYKETAEGITREYNERKFKGLSSESFRLAENEVAARYELRQMFKGELEVDTSKKYGDRLNNLLENIGVNMLDTLCCGESERFVCLLNKVFSKNNYMWTIKNNPSGRFNYTYSANIFAEGEQAGVICWGGKNLGCYVSFMGTGCEAIDFQRLYQEIQHIPEIKITRIDLAYDDFSGTRSIKSAKRLAEQGAFNCGGRPSSYMYVESGHLCKAMKQTYKRQFAFVPDKGRTLYVGSRESGKLLRVYEKGIQMGDPKDKWVRWELELHSSQRVIPLETMIKPSEFLAGAYPALHFLNEEQSVIKTVVKKALMTVEKIIENQVVSTRKAINMMRHLCDMSDSEIVDKFLVGIKNPLSKEAFPKRLLIPITEQQFLEQTQSI